MTTGADWLDTARRVVDTFLTPPAPSPSAPSSTPSTAPSSSDAAAGAGEGTGHADTCRWCPVCQAMAVARGERPEVTAALADLLTTTAGALRTFAESVPAPEHEAADSTPQEATREDDTPEDAARDVPPARTVQRIDIG